MTNLDTITAATLGTLILGLTLWVLVTLAQWAASGMDVTAGILR